MNTIENNTHVKSTTDQYNNNGEFFATTAKQASLEKEPKDPPLTKEAFLYQGVFDIDGDNKYDLVYVKMDGENSSVYYNGTKDNPNCEWKQLPSKFETDLPSSEVYMDQNGVEHQYRTEKRFLYSSVTFEADVKIKTPNMAIAAGDGQKDEVKLVLPKYEFWNNAHDCYDFEELHFVKIDKNSLSGKQISEYFTKEIDRKTNPYEYTRIQDGFAMERLNATDRIDINNGQNLSVQTFRDASMPEMIQDMQKGVYADNIPELDRVQDYFESRVPHIPLDEEQYVLDVAPMSNEAITPRDTERLPEVICEQPPAQTYSYIRELDRYEVGQSNYTGQIDRVQYGIQGEEADVWVMNPNGSRSQVMLTKNNEYDFQGNPTGRIVMSFEADTRVQNLGPDSDQTSQDRSKDIVEIAWRPTIEGDPMDVTIKTKINGETPTGAAIENKTGLRDLDGDGTGDRANEIILTQGSGAIFYDNPNRNAKHEEFKITGDKESVPTNNFTIEHTDIGKRVNERE